MRILRFSIFARFLATFILTSYLVSGSFLLSAESFTDNGIKARLADLRRTEFEALTFSPLKLAPQTQLTIISPSSFQQLSQIIKKALVSSHQTVSSLIKEPTPLNIVIKLVDEESFYRKNLAPRWTNAMFQNGLITLPISSSTISDSEAILRTLRHEYTHAVIYSKTQGRCLGWIDEGLAQFLEGATNPLITVALKRWLSRHPPIPFALLKGGFTKLNSDLVPAAYAQSLYAAKLLIAYSDKAALSLYFDSLEEGLSLPEAFQRAFGMAQEKFERHLENSLIQWGQQTVEAR